MVGDLSDYRHGPHVADDVKDVWLLRSRPEAWHRDGFDAHDGRQPRAAQRAMKASWGCCVGATRRATSPTTSSMPSAADSRVDRDGACREIGAAARRHFDLLRIDRRQIHIGPPEASTTSLPTESFPVTSEPPLASRRTKVGIRTSTNLLPPPVMLMISSDSISRVSPTTSVRRLLRRLSS